MIGATFVHPRPARNLSISPDADPDSDDHPSSGEANSRNVTSCDDRYAKTDWVFCLITVVQLITISVAASSVSPTKLNSDIDKPGLHVWSTAAIGSLFCIAPTLLAAQYAGHLIVRYAFAVAQVIWAGVIIYLCEGVPVSHLCIIVSLFLLTLYRDYRVLITAASVAALDYVIRSKFFPHSLYGDRVVIQYQWLEHINWLAIVTGFLCVISYRWGRRTNHGSTSEHASSSDDSGESLDRDEAYLYGSESGAPSLARQSDGVFDAADPRYANRLIASEDAEHAIHELLNRISISVTLLHDRSGSSRVSSLASLSQNVTNRKDDLADYLTKDSRGKHFPSMLNDLARKLTNEHRDHQRELEAIQQTIEQLKTLVEQSVVRREEAVTC